VSFKQSPFDRYSIEYNTRQLFEATISVYGAKGTVGAINFVQNSDPVPEPQILGSEIQIYFRINRFNDVFNILRKEKSLQLMANTDTKYGSIISGSEPVGEDEGV
jgi:hypothetical protein